VGPSGFPFTHANWFSDFGSTPWSLFRNWCQAGL
jgi:hypothetical protein